MNRTEALVRARATKAEKEGTVSERFWKKVERKGDDECWPWLAAPRHQGQGYGAFWLNGRHQPASRVALVLSGVSVPEGMFACHRCDNPACCNPVHLFVGSHDDNMIDKVAKGRQIKGERVHTCRLTKEQVAEIRAAKPVGKRAPNGLPAQLATKYGVTKQYLSEIWSGKSWRQS